MYHFLIHRIKTLYYFKSLKGFILIFYTKQMGIGWSMDASVMRGDSLDLFFWTEVNTLEIVFSLALSILLIVALWKVFEKAGEKGWKSLIPLYNLYIYCKIAWSKGWFWLLGSLPLIGIIWMFLSVFLWFLSRDSGLETMRAFSSFKNMANRLLGLLSTFSLIATVVATCVVNIRMAKKFGKSTGFGIGLIFLSGIFIPILWFWSAEYQEKEQKSDTKDEELTVNQG